MCRFQSLYFDDDGYVVCCRECSYYQVAFGSTMLSLSPQDFRTLIYVVKNKAWEECFTTSEGTRNVIITTPSPGLCLLLTQKEAARFSMILETAQNEDQAQQMIRMFNPTE